MKTAILIFLSFFTSQIFCETNTDVIESFANIFEKYHQNIGEIQSFSHGNASEASRQYFSTVFHAQHAIMQKQQEAKKTIDQKVKEVLESLQISENDERIQKCKSDVLSDYDLLVVKSFEGFSVCKKYNEVNMKNLTELLEKLYAKQYQSHLDLESTKLSCNTTSSNTDILKNCLSNELFVNQSKIISKLGDESESFLNNYKLAYATEEENLKKCSKLVHETISDNSNEVATKFNSCARSALNLK